MYVCLSFPNSSPTNTHLKRNDFIITMGPFSILSFFDFFFSSWEGGGAGERICVLAPRGVCQGGGGNAQKKECLFFLVGGGKRFRGGRRGFWDFGGGMFGFFYVHTVVSHISFIH